MNVPVTDGHKQTPLEPLVCRVESMSFLDVPAKAVGGKVRGAIARGGVKQLLSGTWLGHAVHPMLTDVVIGSFISASLVDLVAGQTGGKASERLIALGIGAYAPTALTGLNDWADTEAADERVRRAGVVHATTNAAALALYAASLASRRRGAGGRGKLLGLLGGSVLMTGGYLGGHLSLRRGVGANQTAFDPGPTEWTPAADGSQLREGKPTRVVVDETPVLVLREGDRIFAIHDRCSHRGCSLSQGQVDGEEIICACHGSRFDLRDGSVRGGPATAPQPAFQVRQRDDMIEVRRLSPTSL
jgi:nitrite reductase/ring-hydroxylating ferredoxin subunit/uncharacterized membrane protein